MSLPLSPAPFCLLLPPSPGAGSGDKHPELGYHQDKVSRRSHKIGHREVLAGLGAGQWHEAVLSTGLPRTGVFALVQGHPC